MKPLMPSLAKYKQLSALSTKGNEIFHRVFDVDNDVVMPDASDNGFSSRRNRAVPIRGGIKAMSKYQPKYELPKPASNDDSEDDDLNNSGNSTGRLSPARQLPTLSQNTSNHYYGSQTPSCSFPSRVGLGDGAVQA